VARIKKRYINMKIYLNKKKIKMILFLSLMIILKNIIEI
jgi:hypothetical protein